MVYREGVIGESTARKWFAKFKNGNFDIDDMLCSRRPSEFDEDHLKALLKEESRQTSRELAEKINCDQKMILNHLHLMGFAEKLGVWMPHELSKNNKENRLQIASQHLPAIEQNVVTNSAFCTKSSWEMRNGAYCIYKHEAKKGMGGSWRYAKAEN